MMIILEMKNCKMILILKLPKYLLYDKSKLMSMNILLVKKYYHLIKKQRIEQAKFTYSPLEKASEKQLKAIKDQGKKQVKVLEDLKPKELEAIKYNESIDNEKSSIHKEIFDKLSGERIGETYNISKEIDFNN